MSIKYYFLAFFAMILFSITGMLLFFSENIEDYRSAKFSDTLKDTLKEEISRQNRQLTVLAIAISGNEALSASLKTGDRSKALESVGSVLSSFEKFDHDEGSSKIQLHTPQLSVFVRSWEQKTYGTPLEGYRKGLLYVRKTRKPFASVELGKQLNFKAIAPLMYRGEYVGSLEIIKNFDALIERFSKKKISLMILMDTKFLSIADEMVDYPPLEGFVLCHRIYDDTLYKELQKEGISDFIHYQKSFSRHYFISVEPMRDLDGDQLGVFLIAIPKDSARAMMNNESEASILSQSSREELARVYRSEGLESDNQMEVEAGSDKDYFRSHNDIKRGEIR